MIQKLELGLFLPPDAIRGLTKFNHSIRRKTTHANATAAATALKIRKSYLKVSENVIHTSLFTIIYNSKHRKLKNTNEKVTQLN